MEKELVTIELDGRMQASLNWSGAHQEADRCREQGRRIFWNLDLGLFDRLSRPLNDQTQFLSLCLSLEHFHNAIWKEFQADSIGLGLYRGNADFSDHFPWDEEQINNWHGWLQDDSAPMSAFSDVDPRSFARGSWGHRLVSLFCRDVGAEYLDLLVSHLPDGPACYLLLDDSSIASPLWRAQLTTRERYPRFQLGLGEEIVAKTGVCLPSMSLRYPSDFENLDEVLGILQEASVPFRIIPESLLTTEWEGLDSLLVVSRSVSTQGRRKLLGFCAAGGLVVTLGGSLGLPQECSFEGWREIKQICILSS
jgi:hypothetical protein